MPPREESQVTQEEERGGWEALLGHLRKVESARKCVFSAPEGLSVPSRRRSQTGASLPSLRTSLSELLLFLSKEQSLKP